MRHTHRGLSDLNHKEIAEMVYLESQGVEFPPEFPPEPEDGSLPFPEPREVVARLIQEEDLSSLSSEYEGASIRWTPVGIEVVVSEWDAEEVQVWRAEAAKVRKALKLTMAGWAKEVRAILNAPEHREKIENFKAVNNAVTKILKERKV